MPRAGGARVTRLPHTPSSRRPAQRKWWLETTTTTMPRGESFRFFRVLSEPATCSHVVAAAHNLVPRFSPRERPFCGVIFWVGSVGPAGLAFL